MNKYFKKLVNVENSLVERLVPPGEMETINHVAGEEIKKTLRKIRPRKSVKLENIPAEGGKSLKKFGIKLLVKWFKEIMDRGLMPSEWHKSVLVSIYENKGDIRDCGNYQGIKLMSHTKRILKE